MKIAGWGHLSPPKQRVSNEPDARCAPRSKGSSTVLLPDERTNETEGAATATIFAENGCRRHFCNAPLRADLCPGLSRAALYLMLRAITEPPLMQEVVSVLREYSCHLVAPSPSDRSRIASPRAGPATDPSAPQPLLGIRPSALESHRSRNGLRFGSGRSCEHCPLPRLPGQVQRSAEYQNPVDNMQRRDSRHSCVRED